MLLPARYYCTLQHIHMYLTLQGFTLFIIGVCVIFLSYSLSQFFYNNNKCIITQTDEWIIWMIAEADVPFDSASQVVFSKC